MNPFIFISLTITDKRPMAEAAPELATHANDPDAGGSDAPQIERVPSYTAQYDVRQLVAERKTSMPPDQLEAGHEPAAGCHARLLRPHQERATRFKSSHAYQACPLRSYSRL